jgi:hypothetical protein
MQIRLQGVEIAIAPRRAHSKCRPSIDRIGMVCWFTYWVARSEGIPCESCGIRAVAMIVLQPLKASRNPLGSNLIGLAMRSLIALFSGCRIIPRMSVLRLRITQMDHRFRPN